MTHQLIENLVNRSIDLNTPIITVLEKAGVNESTWWRWKTGKASPTLSTLQRIGRALDEIEADAKTNDQIHP
jgi:predicted transcriptional regulator